MKVDNLALGDYITKRNAFGPNWQTGFVPATASFDVVWSAPVTRRLDFQDATHIDQFSGSYLENQVSVTWSASNANGFSFTANPGDLSTSFSGFAELGHEQNGIFFTSDSTTAAALAPVLVAPEAAPASSSPTFMARHAETLTATQVGNSQPAAVASQPHLPGHGATHPSVWDQFFPDLSGQLLETF
jgi:hypothetical protein